MLRFVVRRLLLLVPILLGLSVLIFGWIHALPGSPQQFCPSIHATVGCASQTHPMPRQFRQSCWVTAR